MTKSYIPYRFGPYPPVSGQLKGKMTYYEVEGMNAVLMRIADMYQAYTSLLPDHEETTGFFEAQTI